MMPCMGTLMTCQGISKHYGTRKLFDGLSIGFGDGERVGFVGPNGSGKTTFLKIIAGLEEADAGEVRRRREGRVVLLEQQDRFAAGATVFSALADALVKTTSDVHERETAVAIALGKFGFENPTAEVGTLSGGWRKRLAIVRALLQDPDLLLLDEPTNHLDIAGIRWLEQVLMAASFGFVAVSHDRYFLETVADRMVELNPVYADGYFSVSGRYSDYLHKRADFLEAQQSQQATLANIVRREEAFLRSNSKAQRTKSKSRIEEAYRLQDELRDLSSRNARATAAGIEFDATGRKSKKLIHAEGVSKSLGGRKLFEDVSLLLSPGMRVGILGANGSGKTTLIRVLTGALEPDEGTLDFADDLKVVVFDQNREKLPQDVTLRYALAGESKTVEFRGKDVHISAWAKQFLFSTQQLEMPVGELSGGEQARVQIARLMLQPADVLVLDEPTNDLDITSLDVLEDRLIGFDGAVILVTHDRFMLERVCTELIGLDGDGRVGKYAHCDHWLDAVAGRRVDESPPSKVKTKGSGGKRKEGGLTASEKSELKEIEGKILEAEERVETCQTATEDPEIAGDHVEVQKRWEALESARKDVEALYARWEDLEARSG